MALKHHQHSLQAEAVWGKAYGVFDRIVQLRGFRTGVEVGVAFGGHIEALLNIPTIEKVYGVDPYQQTGTSSSLGLSQSEMDTLYLFVLNRLAPFGDRYQPVRKSSVEASSIIPQEIDFVYIDADHSYQEVMADLCAWFPKVREGGIIGGHDYSHPDLPGVKKAVDRFFSRFAQRVHSLGEYVWWIEKKMPSISFVLPAYNCAEFVEESVKSIQKGNFEDGDELIIVDDGSSDNTLMILQRLAAYYPSIRLLKHDSNRGASAARNTAIASAKNSLLFNLDSDNILVPGSIPKLKTYLISSNADIAVFEETRFFRNGTGQITHSWKYGPGLLTLSDCLAGQITPGASGNYMFTKESWAKAEGYPEFAKTYETWGFAFRQLATGSKMMAMPDSFYLHRYGHSSLWVREGGNRNASRKTLKMILPFLGLLDYKDVEYIMSHKETWLTNLSQHPIRVKGSAPGNSGSIKLQSPPLDYMELLCQNIDEET